MCSHWTRRGAWYRSFIWTWTCVVVCFSQICKRGDAWVRKALWIILYQLKLSGLGMYFYTQRTSFLSCLTLNRQDTHKKWVFVYKQRSAIVTLTASAGWLTLSFARAFTYEIHVGRSGLTLLRRRHKIIILIQWEVQLQAAHMSFPLTSRQLVTGICTIWKEKGKLYPFVFTNAIFS